MLKIHIPAVEDYWDEKKNEFVSIKAYDLYLEHSLVSVAEWEARWHKPFLGDDEKTNEQLADYIRCMVRKRNVDEIDERIFNFIPEEELIRIQKYIEDDHTATFFREDKKGPTGGRRKKEILTSEVLYYYMIALNIPMECQKWHLGRLQTLIKVCNEKNKEMDPKYKGKKKLTASESANLARKYHDINAANRALLNTRG